MRMLVASLVTETNTFSPLPVDRRAFERAFYASPGKHPQTATLCSAPVVAARRRVKSDDFTLIEGTSTWAEPAGLVSRGGYESLRDEILGQLRAAMPVDIALFGLHGAMVADANGLAITPHGKTTMSPQLFAMQMDAGAWAITVALATGATRGLGWQFARTLAAAGAHVAS